MAFCVILTPEALSSSAPHLRIYATASLGLTSQVKSQDLRIDLILQQRALLASLCTSILAVSHQEGSWSANCIHSHLYKYLVQTV